MGLFYSWGTGGGLPGSGDKFLLTDPGPVGPAPLGRQPLGQTTGLSGCHRRVKINHLWSKLSCQSLSCSPLPHHQERTWWPISSQWLSGALEPQFSACKMKQTPSSQPALIVPVVLSHCSSPICLPQRAVSKPGHRMPAGASQAVQVMPPLCCGFVSKWYLSVFNLWSTIISKSFSAQVVSELWHPVAYIWFCLKCSFLLLFPSSYVVQSFVPFPFFLFFFFLLDFFEFSFCSITSLKVLFPSLCFDGALRGTLCYSAILSIRVWNRAGPRADRYLQDSNWP